MGQIKQVNQKINERSGRPEFDDRTLLTKRGSLDNDRLPSTKGDKQRVEKS